MEEGWETSPSDSRAGDTGFRGKAVRSSREPLEVFSFLEKEAREVGQGR